MNGWEPGLVPTRLAELVGGQPAPCSPHITPLHGCLTPWETGLQQACICGPCSPGGPKLWEGRVWISSSITGHRALQESAHQKGPWALSQMGIIVTWRGIKGLHSHVALTATVDKVSLNSLLGPPILPPPLPHTHRAHLGELTLPSPSTPPTHCGGQGHQASHPNMIRKKHLHPEHLLPHEVSWLCFDHYHHHPHLEETGLTRRGSECRMWPRGCLSLEVWPQVPPTWTPQTLGPLGNPESGVALPGLPHGQRQTFLRSGPKHTCSCLRGVQVPRDWVRDCGAPHNSFLFSACQASIVTH